MYSARVRAAYAPLGEYLAARGNADPGKAELDSVKNTQKTYWKVFWEQAEIADSAVTPSQRELIPMFKSLLAVPLKDREHSQWQFGHPVTFKDNPKKGANAVTSPPSGKQEIRTGKPRPY